MNIEILREYALQHPGVTEGFPFGEQTLVFKVMGKVFLLAPLEGPLRVNAKCDPQRAVELREHYTEITPGYHMNKQQWNTMDLSTGQLPDALVYELVDHSYALVIRGLSRKLRDELAEER